MRRTLARRMRVTISTLVVGSVGMVTWEDSPAQALPIVRVGLLVLAVGLVALLVELRGPAGLWRMRTGLSSGPARLLVVGAGLTLALVLVSSHTNGCVCDGGAQGLFELALWSFLVLTVVLVAPSAAGVLLAAVGLGCLVAGALALAGAHAASEMAPGSTRLAGTYGNPNYFAATQAMGLPIAVAGLVQWRRWAVRGFALVAGLTMTVALFLSYSRSGLLAGTGGATLTVLLLVAPKRRMVVGAAIAVAGGLAVLILYPTFAAQRTTADFAGRITIDRETDASGWRRSETGLLPAGPSLLANAGPGILRITAIKPGEGVSVPLGPRPADVAVHLGFQARASGRLALHYGMEDNLIAAGPISASTLLSTKWKRYGLAWRPAVPAGRARAYFWLTAAGTFALRAPVIWTTDPGLPTALSTRLLGPPKNRKINQQVQRAERAYVASREGAARIAVQAFRSHPLVGIGWDRFPAYAATRSGVGAIATHNEYLRFAAELGLLGLVAIGLLCVAAGWAAVLDRAQPPGPALIGVLVAAGIELAFGNVLESPAVILPAGTAAAVGVALSVRRRATEERPSP